MDSISQVALGASIAHLTLGERLGKRALIVGAVLGTLPDMDVLVPYADAIESFTYHRSWSHSVFVLSAVSLPVAWLLAHLFRRTPLSFNRCWIATWLVLVTHPLLDSFTTYGTQIFWPLMPPPAAWGSVFIIDPLYTVPLLFGMVVAWRRSFDKSKRTVAVCLCLSTVYLGWTLVAQGLVRHKAEATLARLGTETQNVLVAPFPLSLVWRIVVQSENAYYEGYSSLLDSQEEIVYSRYDNGKSLCVQWLNDESVKRLEWFTQGFYALSVDGDELVASDLRIGVEGSYIFRFVIAERSDEQWRKILTRQLPVEVDTVRMRQIARRAVDETLILPKLVRQVPAQC